MSFNQSYCTLINVVNLLISFQIYFLLYLKTINVLKTFIAFLIYIIMSTVNCTTCITSTMCSKSLFSKKTKKFYIQTHSNYVSFWQSFAALTIRNLWFILMQLNYHPKHLILNIHQSQGKVLVLSLVLYWLLQVISVLNL